MPGRRYFIFLIIYPVKKCEVSFFSCALLLTVNELRGEYKKGHGL